MKFGFTVSFFGSTDEISKKNEPSCNMFGVTHGSCPILGAGPSKPAAGMIMVALMGTSPHHPRALPPSLGGTCPARIWVGMMAP